MAANEGRRSERADGWDGIGTYSKSDSDPILAGGNEVRVILSVGIQACLGGDRDRRRGSRGGGGGGSLLSPGDDLAGA
jgi:hypothetical protein